MIIFKKLKELKMPAKRTSSVIENYLYISYRKELFIRFKDSGDLYVYFDVPKETYKGFTNSTSLGQYFNANIKLDFNCEKIDI